ncbi:MAG TPA: hypothetical protein VLU73_04405 [Methylococcaceae bacterium]|nr:hypothetical protein [Methylococcaceae bacterium]
MNTARIDRQPLRTTSFHPARSVMLSYWSNTIWHSALSTSSIKLRAPYRNNLVSASLIALGVPNQLVRFSAMTYFVFIVLNGDLDNLISAGYATLLQLARTQIWL